jgi:glycosyltransferase involved in cell wall biosynthesis
VPAGGARLAITVARLGPYHVARLAAAGRAFGAESVLALEIAGDSREYPWDRVDGDGFRRRTLLVDRDYQDVPALELRRRTIAALEEEDPDAVAVSGWGFAEGRAAVAWCRARGRVAILMSDSQERDAPRSWHKEAWKRAFLTHVDSALVAGERHARYLERLGVPRARVALGYDAVDNDHFRRGARAARAAGAELRRRLGLPERYVLAIARFVRKKNLPRLLEAYRMYRRQVGPRAWDLVLVGDGPDRERIERARDALGLGAAVSLPGFRQYGELPAYYGLARAFVLASTVEQWGLVVNEAMASGLPVLVSHACGAAELVRDGVTGYRFDGESVADVARALAQLTADEPRLDAMGAAAAAAVERMSPDGFAAGLVAALEAGRRHAASRTRAALPRFSLWL